MREFMDIRIYVLRHMAIYPQDNCVNHTYTHIVSINASYIAKKHIIMAKVASSVMKEYHTLTPVVSTTTL